MDISEPEGEESAVDSFKTPKHPPITYDLEGPSSTKSEQAHSRAYGAPPEFMQTMSAAVARTEKIERIRIRPLADFDPPRVFIRSDNKVISAFFTKRYCFSNHFICPTLVIDGMQVIGGRF